MMKKIAPSINILYSSKVWTIVLKYAANNKENCLKMALVKTFKIIKNCLQALELRYSSWLHQASIDDFFVKSCKSWTKKSALSPVQVIQISSKKNHPKQPLKKQPPKT